MNVLRFSNSTKISGGLMLSGSPQSQEMSRVVNVSQASTEDKFASDLERELFDKTPSQYILDTEPSLRIYRLDKEILEMKTKYEKDLKAERETLVKVRGELGIMKKKNINSLKELDSHKENIDWMGKEQVRFKIEIKTSEKDKIDLKREIRSRDSTILNKEKEITKLKNELRHMENTKYVFQHRIKTLQEEIKPKEEKISGLKQQILDMEGELTSNVKNQSEITAQTEELRGKLTTALQDLTGEKRKVHLAAAQNGKFLKEFELLQPVLQDSKKLKEGVLNLYNKVLYHPCR